MRQGSATAAEIFLAVGSALSWWEGSEDVLMGLFSKLVMPQEPVAFDAFVASGRGARGKFLKNALERSKHRFTTEEISELKTAMKELDKLAPMRNEIAHGHVSDVSHTVENVVTMKGAFLMPSLNEQGWHQRDQRYAHTAEEIRVWEAKVRLHRGKIMDAEMSALLRWQAETRAMSERARNTKMFADAISRGQIPPDTAEIVWVDPAATGHKD